MSFDGTWNCTMDTPLGERKIVLTLAENGAELTGTLGDGSATTPIQDGKVSGDKGNWKANITSPMSMTLEFTVAVNGNAMTGSVKLGAFGSAPLQGTRA